ncbi:4Fe-4S dicluster domain-containing protein, partial [Photobacterium sp. OFAV2-7]|uniref:4Fe-4S dicluster domain-containing protein n=1 Tax=Photobacterium sp. OFAV2-7 TaxID=2917748 RepID=UPI001EF6CFDF
LKGLPLVQATPHDISLRWDDLSHCEQQFEDHSYISTGINKLNADDMSASFWQDVGVQCLGCSGCTTLCPTCSCYGTQSRQIIQASEASVQNSQSVPDSQTGQGTSVSQQVRFWDSCLYEGFQREASFHNPAEQAGERVKRFWYHKFSDDFLPEFGRYGCVGCGRCERTCPGVIGVHSIMKRIVNDA